MHLELIGQTPFTFKMAEAEDLLKETFKLRYKVYCEECHFISENDYPDKSETDEYDDKSLHFAALDPYGVIGSARLILDSELPFPIEAHCKDLNITDQSFNKRYAGEISRLVISKSYRRRKDDAESRTADNKGTLTDSAKTRRRISL